MKNDELKEQIQKNENTLSDQQIDQVSGGTLLPSIMIDTMKAGAVGDMKKDPA